MTEKNADVVVIGGGVIGLSTAWHISRKGAQVTVLDSAELGHASPAAAGMLAPLAESSGPGPMLDLALASLKRYPKFVENLREESGQLLEICGPGMLRVARTEEEDTVLCRAIDWQQSLGLPLHRLTGDEVRRLESASAPDILSAILSPAERHIEPPKLLAALVAACLQRGVKLHSPCQAVGIERVNHRVSAVRTEHETYSCDSVVLAGGAWSSFWSEILNCPIPITPLRGQILALGPHLPSLLRHTLYTHGSYLVPRSDGRIVAGATEEHAGFTAETTELAIDGLRTEAATLVPILIDWPLQSAWAGLRPLSADGLPLMGRIPGFENAYLAGGHGRNGILLTPITGSLMADLIMEGIAPPPAFDPARFGGST